MIDKDTTDQEIISQYIHGYDHAFDQLVKRYISSVYNFVYSIVRNESDAEDIVQDTFLKVWKNIKKYNKKYTFKTWLLTIARNTAYDYTRKRKHILFSEFENDEGDNAFVATLTDLEPLAHEVSILVEDKKMLHGALEKISPKYAEILTLRYGEEMTFEEIGAILDRPMNTVKSQARRALIELREIINKNPHNTYAPK